MRLPLQALGLDLRVEQLAQVGFGAFELARLERCSVEAQQGLDLVLQHHGVLVQDASHLALVVGQRAGHLVLQQGHTFTHGGQRGFEFVGDVAQKTGLVGVQLGQPQAQPLQALAHTPHVGRAPDLDRVVQPVFTQADDGTLQPLEGAAEPHTQGHGHQQRQRHRAHHQPDGPPPAGVQLCLQGLVALGDGALHALGNFAVEGVEGTELLRHCTFALQGGVGRAVQQAADVGQLPPPAGGQRGGDVVGLQDVQHPARVGGGVVKTFAQQAVVQHQRLARRPLQIGVALGQHLRRCTQLQRALRKTAALRHQLVEGVDRAQRNAAQQQGDQHKGQQQQLLERAAQRPGCAHPAVTRAGAALLRAGQFHHAASSPALRSPSHWPSGPPAAARSGWR